MFDEVYRKGGTAKTVTTLALGNELGKLGRRVLLIDMDPQANLTFSCGYDTAQIAISIYEALLQPDMGVARMTLQTPHGIDLVPATLALAGAELVLSGRIGRELILRTAIQEARRVYDYVLIDTPPSLGLFTINAVAAADAVLVPLQAHAFAWRALPQLEETIALVRQLNPPIQIGGIAITMYDRRTSLCQAIADEARATYGDRVFKTMIPVTITLAEAPALGQPIGTYAPDSPAATAYRELAQEADARYGH